MEYIQQLNEWDVMSVEKHVSPKAQALYTRLLFIINRHARGKDWPEWYPIGRKQLARELGISTLKTITKLRQELEGKGFIQTRAGENKYTDCTEYHIVKLYDDKPATQNQPHKDKQEIVEALAAIEGDAVGTWQVMTDEKGVFHIVKRDAAGFLVALGVQTCRQYMEQAQSKRSPGAWLYKVLMGEASKARENNKIAAAALELKRKQQEEAQAQQAAALQQAAADDGDIYSFSMK